MEGGLAQHAQQDLPARLEPWCVEHLGGRPPQGRGLQIRAGEDPVAEGGLPPVGGAELGSGQRRRCPAVPSRSMALSSAPRTARSQKISTSWSRWLTIDRGVHPERATTRSRSLAKPVDGAQHVGAVLLEVAHDERARRRVLRWGPHRSSFHGSGLRGRAWLRPWVAVAAEPCLIRVRAPMSRGGRARR